MIKLDENLLVELGLGSLPKPEKTAFLKHMYETLEMRVGTRLAERMSDQQMSEFEQFINSNDEQGAFHWLESNFPNYKDVVAEEFEKLKGEISPLAGQIVSASQAQQQGQDQLQPGGPATVPNAADPFAAPAPAQPVPQEQAFQPVPAPQPTAQQDQPVGFGQPAPAYQSPASDFSSPAPGPAAPSHQDFSQSVPVGPAAPTQAPASFGSQSYNEPAQQAYPSPAPVYQPQDFSQPPAAPQPQKHADFGGQAMPPTQSPSPFGAPSQSAFQPYDNQAPAPQPANPFGPPPTFGPAPSQQPPAYGQPPIQPPSPFGPQPPQNPAQ